MDSPCRFQDQVQSWTAPSRETHVNCGAGEYCRLVVGSEARGKHACASAPVDFRRAALSRAQAAPRVAPPAPANALQLHSRPGATKVIYLDFDGQVVQNTPWNQGLGTITVTAYDMDSNPSSFSAAELANIVEIWQRIAECYSPFDVDVTTEAPAVADLINSGGGDTKWGQRILFGTPNPSPAPGSGGVAYVDVFGWNYGTGVDVPCFVLQDGVGTFPKYNADAAVHECGHTLGLDHDGLYSANDSRHVEYYEGQGFGNVGWAPHMGAGYYQPLVQWSRGEYANPSNTEDDLNIIATHNGFTVRSDDFASNQGAAQAIPGASIGAAFMINVGGVIETRTDTDWFKIVANTGAIIVNAVGGPANTMLDIQLSLYDGSGALITSANPPADVIASLNQTVAAGTYYLKIEGVGFGSPLTTGYTDYSSLGQYTITGSFSTGTASGGSPVLGGTNDQFYGISQAPKNINVGITVSDADSAALASATVKITNFVATEDKLAATLQPATTGNITATYNVTTGTLTLTSPGGTATVAQFQAALRSVTYANSSTSPVLTPRNVDFQVSDGKNLSNISTSVISIGYFYVAASYNSATRTLSLADDVGDNSVSVAMKSGQLTVQGAGATRIGTPASSRTSVSFPVGATVIINATFSGGSDQITLTGVSSSNATFNLGNGNDVLNLNLCNISKLTVDGGIGADVVTTTGSIISSRSIVNVP